MNFRDKMAARKLARQAYFKALDAGKTPKQAGDAATAAVKAKFPSIDPAMLAMILEIIKMLIALFSK